MGRRPEFLEEFRVGELFTDEENFEAAQADESLVLSDLLEELLEAQEKVGLVLVPALVDSQLDEAEKEAEPLVDIEVPDSVLVVEEVDFFHHLNLVLLIFCFREN